MRVRCQVQSPLPTIPCSPCQRKTEARPFWIGVLNSADIILLTVGKLPTTARYRSLLKPKFPATTLEAYVSSYCTDMPTIPSLVTYMVFLFSPPPP
jgi:hypothetical protein